MYNVSSGHGVALAEVFSRLAALAGWRGEARPSQELIRPTDISHLVGDSTKLRQATDWEPRVTLDETLNEVLRAQAE